ncbi:MAG: hypothetical protein ACHQ52_13520 [Candidatus Eisenbacteria bacterium]
MNTTKRHVLVARLWAGMAALLVTSGIVAVTAPAAGAAGSNTLTVTAGEYTYQFKGSPKAGLTQINFVNSGVETHMMAVSRLKPGVTVAQLKAALLSQEPNAGQDLLVGDGNVGATPGLLGPGKKTGIITKLPSGHYGVFCFLPAPDGRPHVAHGMVKTFDVAKGKSNLTAPTDGVIKVDLTDTSAAIPATLPAKGYAKFTNSSSTVRSVGMADLQPGVTVQQADAYFNTLFGGSAPPEGQPPALLAGGFESLPKGASVYLVLQFEKGHYGYSSNNPDLPDNDPNPVLGEFTVK